MPNPFQSESKTAMLSINLEGVCKKLRMTPTLHDFLISTKPAHISFGDYLARGALDQWLLHLVSLGRYDEVQSTLAALFGPPRNASASVGTGVPSGNGNAWDGVNRRRN